MYGLPSAKPSRGGYWAYPPLQMDAASVRIGARADILMFLKAGLEQEAAITLPPLRRCVSFALEAARPYLTHYHTATLAICSLPYWTPHYQLRPQLDCTCSTATPQATSTPIEPASQPT